MSPKPESVNPNPKINQDHLQVAQTIFASYMTRELNYFGDFNASGTPQGYFNKIILFVSEYGEETLWDESKLYDVFILRWDHLMQTNLG